MRTLGRYAFTDPGTPHYPGEHYLGSLNWVTTDRDGANPPMGEWQRDARASGRPWHNGSFGSALPLPLVVGSRACIAQGETYPPSTAGRILIHGVDSRCWQHNPEPCGAGELAGGGIRQYLPNSTSATELAGGGAVEPDEFLGATELAGGGAVEADAYVGAMEFAGGGLDEKADGATELAGGGAVEPEGEECGATELAGGGAVEPDEFLGATELAGGGAVEPEGEECGATELAGGGTTEGVSPGSTCLSAGVGTLGAPISQTGRPNGDDWYSFDGSAGGNYHLDLTVSPGKGTVSVYYGTCAGLTQIGSHSLSGCYDYSGVPAATTLYVKYAITFTLGTDYALTMDAGTC